MKISKKQKNAKKNVIVFCSNLNCILAQKTLKFGFFYFWKSCIELNFHSKNTNLKSIGILNRKLEPKYETCAEDNTCSVSSSTSFQNSNGDQHQICSCLFKQVYLLPQFQKKANNLALKLSHPFPYKKRRPLPFSEPHSLQRVREKVGNKSCCATIVLTLVIVQYFIAFSLSL